jgi:hypothetical protein
MRLGIAIVAIVAICESLVYASHREKRRDLNGRYLEVNELYFDGQLPRAILHYRDDLPDDEMAAITKQGDDNYLIYVRPDADLDYVLGHEACHVLTFHEQAQHGERWEACMRRFAHKRRTF